jgi:hypothetical protein
MNPFGNCQPASGATWSSALIFSARRSESRASSVEILSFPKIACALGFAPASFAPLKLALNRRAHEVGSILVLLKHIGDPPERSLGEPSHHILIPALLPAHASWRTECEILSQSKQRSLTITDIRYITHIS